MTAVVILAGIVGWLGAATITTAAVIRWTPDGPPYGMEAAVCLLIWPVIALSAALFGIGHLVARLAERLLDALDGTR